MAKDKKIRLALISGGESSELEVSLKGGDQVESALDRDKYDIIRYDPAYDLEVLVKDAGRIDAAFVLLHGKYGEDGTIQGLLDLLHIPYQGSGVLGSALAMDKELSRTLYSQAGLNIPRGKVMRPGSYNAEAIAAELGLPVVIKPVDQGSSIGMSIPQTVEGVEKGLVEAFKYSPRVLVEEYIKGVEITGGVIGNDDLEALPIVEIIPGEGHVFFDYQAKYQAGATKEICPARISASLTKNARECAITAHRALRLRGYSRTDMIICDDRIYILETNTIPGMTRTSLLPLAAREAGMDFSALLDKLIMLALEAAGKAVR
ncbi:MAG: D-alanine--D-alanine ligase [Desulfovibrionales bacterium]|nr:D-alanine--D-alanine ligase [Desulfovibrionales bacterium]